jgi:hypothetical protein
MRLLLLCLAASSLTLPVFAGDEVIKFPSPDGKFALRLAPGADGMTDASIIDAKSHAVLVDTLESVPSNHLRSAVLVWSADSRRAAYGYEPMRDSRTQVFFWDGAKFNEVPLLDLPEPHFKKPKLAITHSKLGSDIITPVRWLKSGALVVSRDWDFLLTFSDGSDGEQSATLTITVEFDAQQHPKVQNVSQKTTLK